MNKFKRNTISSFTLQFVTLVCGFILPGLIIKYYGSEVNGLVGSITQFLNIISFLELGVGAVIQSALYKPLANKNIVLTSQIIASANKFFKKIAIILLGYVLLLTAFYPYLIKQNLGYLSTSLLVMVMGGSYFIQYYFGIVNRIILTASQLGYINYTIQIITLVLNTIISVMLIKSGYSIHIVKLVASCIYVVRPIVLYLHVHKYYKINRHVKYEGEPIAQKWNGVAQHTAAIVLDGTDNIILSLFATLSDVSIYSVYYLVIFGVKSFFLSLTVGIQSLIGELWAKQQWKKVKSIFSLLEWSVHTGVVIVFGCTAFLIVPFVKLYTSTVGDVNYIQPYFAVLLVAAHAGHCLRLPYNIMILAGGHYKQTQSNYIVAVIINLVVSIIMVKWWGLVGVAIGTLAAMTYQTVWMAIYNSKHLLNWNIKNFIRQIIVNLVIIVLASAIAMQIPIKVENYFMWLLTAVKISFIWISMSLLVNLIFYNDRLKMVLSYLKVKNIKITKHY